MSFEYAFDAPQSTHCLAIHNDDRTVWAYLHGADGVISDVWLFNVQPAPDEIVPERDRPPLNAGRYCSPDARPVIEYPDDATVRWEYDDSGNLTAAEVIVEGERLARLEPGATPAWSRFAVVDGPCARRLT